MIDAACTGKKQIFGKALADRIARHAARIDRERMQPYRCRICHCWHIGSSIAPRRFRSQK